MKKARDKRCRKCGISEEVKKLTTHHLVPRWKLIRRGETGIIGHPNNLVRLCAPCHRLVEAREAAGGHVHRARLRASLTPSEIDFIRTTMGASWLQWRYPAELPERHRPEPRQATRLVTDSKTGRIKEIAAPVGVSDREDDLGFERVECGAPPDGNYGDAGAA